MATSETVDICGKGENGRMFLVYLSNFWVLVDRRLHPIDSSKKGLTTSLLTYRVGICTPSKRVGAHVHRRGLIKGKKYTGDMVGDFCLFVQGSLSV